MEYCAIFMLMCCILRLLVPRYRTDVVTDNFNTLYQCCNNKQDNDATLTIQQTLHWTTFNILNKITHCNPPNVPPTQLICLYFHTRIAQIGVQTITYKNTTVGTLNIYILYKNVSLCNNVSAVANWALLSIRPVLQRLLNALTQCN